MVAAESRLLVDLPGDSRDRLDEEDFFDECDPMSPKFTASPAESIALDLPGLRDRFDEEEPRSSLLSSCMPLSSSPSSKYEP